jgi:hypothetical protein
MATHRIRPDGNLQFERSSGHPAAPTFDRRQSPLADRLIAVDPGTESVRPVLAPAQFKVLVYAKGWTLRLLAEHWRLSAEYVRRLASDVARSPGWDDAARGLPPIGPARKPRRSWTDGEPGTANTLADLGQPDFGAKTTGTARTTVRSAPTPKGPGFRYHGYMVTGAVVAVSKYLGEMAEEGTLGVVLEVIRERAQERYRVIFESGGIEMFSPDLVDEYLVTTGLERTGLVGYAWRGEESARQDFEAGLFVFDGVEG